MRELLQKVAMCIATLHVRMEEVGGENAAVPEVSDRCLLCGEKMTDKTRLRLQWWVQCGDVDHE